MTEFTPFSAAAGGLLIALAVSLLLLFNGRIAGISGIFAGAIFRKSNERLWRILFLGGMIAGAATYGYLSPDSTIPRTGYPTSLLVIGGFLVGFGTRLGSGCTSGHGICGIARLSMRSLCATIAFMLSGMITVYIVRHWLAI